MSFSCKNLVVRSKDGEQWSESSKKTRRLKWNMIDTGDAITS